MKTTSHFVWLGILSEKFANIFSEVFLYAKNHNLESIIEFQNPLSLHISLYYFDKNLSWNYKNEIQNEIQNFSKFFENREICIQKYNFFKNSEKYIYYFEPKDFAEGENIFKKFHEKFWQTQIIENNYAYIPHITFCKISASINDFHRKNIEKILEKEISYIKNENIFDGKISLYAVNSLFANEIQIKI